MARQVLPIVGAIVGAFFGAPQLGYAIGALIGNAVDPLVVQGPKIGDVANQTSSEGVFQPIYFGTACGAGNIVAQGPNIIKKKRQRQGKGGPVTVTERLYKTFAIRIGVGWNGPITGVTRIWEDEKLVYDVLPGSQIVADSNKFAEGFRLYLGTEDQLPDPDLEAIFGIGNTPAYPGRAYIVFIKKDITDRRSISSYRFEVVTDGSITPGTAMMAIKGTGSNSFARPSPDGEDWSAPYEATGQQFTYFHASKDRYIGWSLASGATNVPFYKEVGGVAWVPSTPLDDMTGGKRDGCIDPESNNVYLGYASGATGGIGRSLDGGDSIGRVPGTPNMDSLFLIGSTLVGIQFGDIYASLNNGSVFSLQPVGIDFSIDYRAASDTELALVGGSTPGPNPKLYEFSGPQSFIDIALPFVSADKVTAVGIGIFDGDKRPFCGTDSGEIAYREPGGSWVLATDNFGCQVRGVTYNGDYFFACGDDRVGAGTATGYIKRSLDCDEWELVHTESLADGEILQHIQALKIADAQLNTAQVRLADIVAWCHQTCNQSSANYDVSELEDIMVDGLILGGGYTGADAIRTLAGIYFFDSAEPGTKIVHTLRGKPVVATLTIDDLVDEPEEATRGQAIEYPKKLHLDYQNALVDYAPAKATSSRSSQDARVVGEANVQAPVVMTSDKAFQKAAALHKISWADADGEVNFTIPDSFLRLIPGNCVGLQLRGTVRRLRIDKMEYNPGTIKLFTRNDRQSAYTSNVTGVPLVPPTPPPSTIVGPTELEVLDIPALLDIHDQPAPVRYIAAGGLSPAWYGATIQDRLPAETEYSDLLTVNDSTIMGTLQEDITDASEWYTDTTNRLLIQFDQEEELDSLTQAQFLSEGGAIAVANADGSWELMQARDWDDLGGGLYELSYLQRGRLASGTESHSAGMRVVVLDGVKVVSTPSSYIGQVVDHRAISLGNSPETATVDTITFAGKSQIEFPCASLLLARDTDTISGLTVPRHRFGTEDNPVRSVNWTGYRWVVTDGTNTLTVDGTSDRELFDVTGWASPVTVSVAQINRLTGPGPYISESIP